MPMELGLELMTIVGPRLADPEGKPGNDVFDERDRIGLSVPVTLPPTFIQLQLESGG